MAEITQVPHMRKYQLYEATVETNYGIGEESFYFVAKDFKEATKLVGHAAYKLLPGDYERTVKSITNKGKIAVPEWL